MSDWEDEYDEGGVAIQKPATKPAPTEWNQPCGGFPKENVSFGVRNGNRFGGPREGRGGRGGDVSEDRSWSGEGRSFTRSAGGRNFGDEKSDSSTPLTLSVESSSVGRVIGMFVNQLFLFQMLTATHFVAS